MAYASSVEDESGVPIAGIIIKGNDIVPLNSIKANIAQSGLRSGSYIKNDTLVTTKRQIPLKEAIATAEEFIKLTTIPGTRISPIVASDVKIDEKTGIVTVNVIEDFSTVNVNDSRRL